MHTWSQSKQWSQSHRIREVGGQYEISIDNEDSKHEYQGAMAREVPPATEAVLGNQQKKLFAERFILAIRQGRSEWKHFPQLDDCFRMVETRSEVEKLRTRRDKRGGTAAKNMPPCGRCGLACVIGCSSHACCRMLLDITEAHMSVACAQWLREMETAWQTHRHVLRGEIAIHRIECVNFRGGLTEYSAAEIQQKGPAWL